MGVAQLKNAELNFGQSGSFISQEELLNSYKPKRVTKNSPTVLDLFCGCGGLSLGFKRAGYNVLGGVDHDKSALLTYEANLKAHAMELDLFDDTWVKQCAKIIGTKSVDVIVGGPPCQGFSLTGTRIADDPRNKLYNAMFVALKYFKPKVVLIENVRGMATLYGGKAKQQVYKEYERHSYKVTSEILDAAQYGVPQHRKRLFFVGVKDGEPSIPGPRLQPSDYVTCREAIGDFPWLPRGGKKITCEGGIFEDTQYEDEVPKNEYQRVMRLASKASYKNHEATKHKGFVIKTIMKLKEGENHKSLPKGYGESRKFNEAWTRYHGDKPSRTIDTGHRNHFHYEQHRVPTVRENARLQSFPDDFVFLGTRTAQNRQVGNAVPVLLSQAIALHLKEKKLV